MGPTTGVFFSLGVSCGHKDGAVVEYLNQFGKKHRGNHNILSVFFFAGLVVNRGAKTFSILRIEILKNFIFLAREASCTKTLKSAAPIIEISIAGSSANFFFE